MTGETFSTRILGTLFIVTAVSMAAAQAQTSLPSPPMGVDVDMPPELSFEAPQQNGADAGGERSIVIPEMVGPGAIQGPEYSSFSNCDECKDGYDLWDGLPAVTESSGTWLQRGFWFSRVDAVVMNLLWSRRDLLLASDGASNPPPFNSTNRFLVLKAAHPGYDGGVRFTLGRFLFRDEQNRNHSVEFTTYGSGDWTHDCAISSLNNGQNLQIPFFLDAVNPSFDNSNFMHVTYTSRVNSFETNYRVKRRMRKDQMILKPSGEWVRRANPTLTREFLIGMRFVELSERFDWQAEDILINGANEDGEYLIHTKNNLFGVQLGGGHAYETGRWSIEGMAKGGVYLNDAKDEQLFSITNNGATDFRRSASEEQLSFVGEVRMTGRWHLTPNFSLRTSYEMLYLTSVALAAHQVNFVPVYSKVATSGDPFYHGASFGLEGYW